MITLTNLREAQERLKGVAVHTPLVRYFYPESFDPKIVDPASMDSANIGAGARHEELYFKAESLQPIGSFKLRGAYNMIASLTAEERSRGVITYSSGNHAQGVAYAARLLGARAVIVMPGAAPRVKMDAVAALGAEIVRVGSGSEERRDKALKLSEAHGYMVIPPYDDLRIIAGQGTAGLEILEDLPDVELVLVPVGGGGLSGGVAAALKLSSSRAKVIGVEPALANDAQQSLRQGQVVRIAAESAASTVADGLRTQSIGATNFEHLTTYLDGVVTVGEEEIRRAMREVITRARLMTEPSGAVTMAAWRFHRAELPASGKTVAILSGGNADPKQVAEVLEER